MPLRARCSGTKFVHKHFDYKKGRFEYVNGSICQCKKLFKHKKAELEFRMRNEVFPFF